MPELQVLSTLAVQRAVEQLSAEFIRSGGSPLRAEFKPTVTLMNQIRAGARADVAILTAEACAGLVADGVLSGSTDLVRSYIGMAVRAGQPHPDISTVDALINTLLNAKSVAYSRIGASGMYIKQLLDTLGIAEVVNAKATVVPDGYTAALAARGEVELAMQQVSELLTVEGIELVGLFPEGVQQPSVFSAGVFSSSSQGAAGQALIDFLRSSQARPVLERCGLEPMLRA